MTTETIGKNGKKQLNFELNLIPIFDILSTCICFLLLTVAWIHIGSLNATQAMGGEAQVEKDNAPAVWAYLNKGGQVVLTMKNAQGLPRNLTDATIPGVNGSVQWEAVATKMASFQKFGPNLRTGLIMPSNVSSYEDIVRLMDQFKKFGIRDVGIAPL